MKILSRYKNREYIDYHLMILPAFVLLCIFRVYPLFGSVLAFKHFEAAKGIWGSPWIGFDNFEMLFMLPEFRQITLSTFFIAITKIVLNFLFSITFALILNEVRSKWYKKSIQTVVYLPFFLSWVIVSGIFKDIFSVQGLVNKLLVIPSGAEPIMFFTNKVWFMVIVFLTDIWKNFGYNTIIFLAALSNINPTLYEAADVDGASRLKKLQCITLPGIKPTIILVVILSLQGILSAGFDQIFNMYNPMVYNVADIYDTYIYRMGFQSSQFEFATAVGLFRSLMGFVFVFTAQFLAKKFGSYRVF